VCVCVCVNVPTDLLCERVWTSFTIGTSVLWSSASSGTVGGTRGASYLSCRWSPTVTTKSTIASIEKQYQCFRAIEALRWVSPSVSRSVSRSAPRWVALSDRDWESWSALQSAARSRTPNRHRSSLGRTPRHLARRSCLHPCSKRPRKPRCSSWWCSGTLRGRCRRRNSIPQRSGSRSGSLLGT